MSKTIKDTLEQNLQNPDFVKEWEALEPEYQLIRAILSNRTTQGLTQKELADITGINQADISRLEKGLANPSLTTLKKLAHGLNMRLKIEFVPLH